MYLTIIEFSLKVDTCLPVPSAISLRVRCVSYECSTRLGLRHFTGFANKISPTSLIPVVHNYIDLQISTKIVK